MRKLFILFFAATTMLAFGNGRLKSCNVKYNGITFTRSLNNAPSLVSVKDDGRLRFEVGEKKDFFCDPNGTTISNAPILFTEIDNTIPFTFTTKVNPHFTPTGTYNAGTLYIYSSNTFWQKFAFEQDERGNHRIVTVRTQGTSDDNNHDIVKQDFAYLRIYSDTRTIAFYYSLDNHEWILVRLYKNNYPNKILLGISSQCPKDKGTYCYFEGLQLSNDKVADIRMGK